MNRRIILSAGGATAGLLTTALLPAAVAFADNATGAIGDVGSTALGSTLTAASAPLGTTGAVTPDTYTTSGSTAPLGDTGSTAPLGDTGSLTPTGGLTPSTGTPDTGTPDATPGATTPGDTGGFTIGQDTFNPVQADGSEGFTPVSPLFSAPPFFQVGSGDQDFDVTSGTGSGATDLGHITTSEDVTNLFGGIHNTEFTVTGADPADGATAADLPAVGSVYDVANFGNGFENIYSDIPGADGSANTITDTLVTPFGDFNVPTDFDAAALLDPGDAFNGVASLGSDAAGGAADAAGAGADAAGAAADAAGGAAGGAADAAGGIGDAMSGLDPSDLLGI